MTATETIEPDALFGLNRDALNVLQSRRWRALLAAIWDRNAFYQRRFQAAGFSSFESIASLSELRRLPFTTKDELVADQAANPPYGSILTFSIDRYVRLHQTSGTTGRPIRWLDTPETWEWIMGLWRVIFAAAGITPSDRFFFPFSFGPFLGFWAGFEAAVSTGHLALPAGGMTTPARIRFMLDNHATVVCCTPTYALHMAEAAAAEGIDLAASDVRTLIVAGEPGGNIPEVKRRIEAAWGARCIDHSGMTEIGSLGFEFRDNPGDLYLIESECIAEIIDPATGAPVSPGTRGELVLTNLGRWGSPLIRYRTGDLVEAAAEPCPLGTSLIRLKGGILGRVDDMVVVRGNNIYPAAVESILRRFPEVAEYRAEVSEAGGLAVLSITVECSPGMVSNGAGLPRRIERAVKDALNVRPEVEAVPPGTLPRFELKARRFFIHPSCRKESS